MDLGGDVLSRTTSTNSFSFVVNCFLYIFEGTIEFACMIGFTLICLCRP